MRILAFIPLFIVIQGCASFSSDCQKVGFEDALEAARVELKKKTSESEYKAYKFCPEFEENDDSYSFCYQIPGAVIGGGAWVTVSKCDIKETTVFFLE